MEENIKWAAENQRGKILHQWWFGLEKDRASRAVLRRCATLNDVALSGAYQRFYRFMLASNAWDENFSSWQNDKLAMIAGLLSHIEKETTESLPHRMSESVGERPALSELRFRDLLKIETNDDLFISLKRALPLISKTANIYQLANDVYWWNDKTKKAWAYSYRWPTKPSK
jgi:CRISPR system Cascade subunit CasB